MGSRGECDAHGSVADGGNLCVGKGPVVCRSALDDSAVVRKIATRMVRALGFDTLQAGNGQIALALCGRAMPDAVLLDWDMPVMDGLTFLLTLRGLRSDGTPKVVFCTAQNEMAQIARAMEAGADDLLFKPVAMDALFDAIGRVLARDADGGVIG